MPKYLCPHCQEAFSDLIDLSEHLDSKVCMQTNVVSSVAQVAALVKATTNRHTIDLVNIPEGIVMKSDLPLLKRYYEKIVERLYIDVPLIKIRFLRSNAKNVRGKFTWTQYCESSQRRNWSYQDGIYVRITVAHEDWTQCLSTLIHEMLHFEDNIENGFMARSWTEAHTGYWAERKDEVNKQLIDMGSPLRVVCSGGIRRGGNADYVKQNIEIGDLVEWEWKDTSGNNVSGASFVTRRNSRMISVKNVKGTVEPSRYQYINKIPYSTVRKINHEDVPTEFE